MLRPEVIAAASDYVRYANGNKASQPLLDPAVINDPAIYPPPEVMARLFVVPMPDPAITKLMTRMYRPPRAVRTPRLLSADASPLSGVSSYETDFAA